MILNLIRLWMYGLAGVDGNLYTRANTWSHDFSRNSIAMLRPIIFEKEPPVILASDKVMQRRTK
jgi:hypothetical protein